MWHQTEFHSGDDTRTPWQTAPELAEDVYTADEAVVVGTLLISLLNHSDRVRMGCLAQLVNVIAPITTEPGGRSWRQATFFPFADVAAHARGQALRAEVASPRHETDRYGDVDSVVAAATFDVEAGELVLYLANRSPDQPLTVELKLAGALAGYRPVAHRVLRGASPGLCNTADRPDAVVPQNIPVTRNRRTRAGLLERPALCSRRGGPLTRLGAHKRHTSRAALG